MTKTNKGYTVNHEAQAIILTKAFAKLSSIPGTKEFRELAALHKHFPEYTIEMRTASVKKDKETHGGLTVERIEKILTAQSDKGELLREYKDFVSFWGKEVQDKQNPGKTVIRAPYGKVKSWYLKKVKEGKIDETLLPTASAEDND